MNFGKVLTAMVTPFDQNGNIDTKRAEALVEHLISNGSDGIVVAGTTGESPTINTEEKLTLFDTVVKTANKRVPILAGTGTSNTAYSVDFTKEASRMGVDGIMVVTPYYNKPSQEGMIAHFKEIAGATKLPVMLYNIPGRSVVNLSTESIIELSKVDNIVSVKEASGDLDQMADIIEHTSDDFSLYSGDDSLTLPTLSIGGDGIVSVASHVIGNEMQQMITAFLEGNIHTAAKWHRKLLPVMKSMFLAPNPTCVKAALEAKGIRVGGVRLPLVEISEELKETIKKALDSI